MYHIAVELCNVNIAQRSNSFFSTLKTKIRSLYEKPLFMGADDRMSVLEQDHYKYDEYSVMDTVIMGNRKLYDIMKEKEALYAKPDFSDADGERAAELEGEFAEMNGWDAETEADQLLNGLGIPMELYTPLFAVARVMGWSAHRIEELLSANKIIRPAYKSLGGTHEYIRRNERE